MGMFGTKTGRVELLRIRANDSDTVGVDVIGNDVHALDHIAIAAQVSARLGYRTELVALDGCETDDDVSVVVIYAVQEN